MQKNKRLPQSWFSSAINFLPRPWRRRRPAQSTLRLDTSSIKPVLDELYAINEQYGSFPEFRNRLLEIVEDLRGGLETRRVNVEGLTASTGDYVLSLHFTQPLLDDVAALRALKREFDVAGQGHERAPL